MRKRIVNGSLAAFGILLLIIDSRTAISGAKNAVELCLYSVIPSIFPFIVLSGMLVSVLNGSHLRILAPIGRLLGIPEGAEGIFISGILGGYPVGAQSVYHGYKRGVLTSNDARRMLAFCNNAGPSFLFGILGSKFAIPMASWILWMIHILSAIMVALLIPARESNPKHTVSAAPVTLTQALKTAVLSMGYICGWILLFRVILAFLDKWVLWLLPTTLRIGIYGILEMANGCLCVDSIPIPGLRFIAASGMLAFGGICVLMQTASVTGELGVKYYLPGKVLQTMISIIFSMIAQFFLFSDSEQIHIQPIIIGISALFLSVCAIFIWKKENKCSIPAAIGV